MATVRLQHLLQHVCSISDPLCIFADGLDVGAHNSGTGHDLALVERASPHRCMHRGAVLHLGRPIRSCMWTFWWKHRWRDPDGQLCHHRHRSDAGGRLAVAAGFPGCLALQLAVDPGELRTIPPFSTDPVFERIKPTPHGHVPDHRVHPVADGSLLHSHSGFRQVSLCLLLGSDSDHGAERCVQHGLHVWGEVGDARDDA
mmetsp:Transcript_92752/g.286366  ORF Transcript_92752/g.286366 Transcript_92752/m.286366 type:complete len:200 (+) Transcript_92752:167-766(+)